MVYGRHSPLPRAKRQAYARDFAPLAAAGVVALADLPLPGAGRPIRPSAQCAGCERSVILRGGELPAAWVELDDPSVPSGKSALCPDCKPKPLRRAPPRLSSAGTGQLLDGCIAVPDAIPAGPLYSGFRIYHWLVEGNAVLRIHGGERARAPGRDEPTHFLATGPDLDRLIIHLSNIRASLKKGKTNG